MINMWLLSFLFFFQAEDGIRDIGVTGVQTCALPIWGGAIGTLALYRGERVPFSESQIQLAKAFADQAVIAIENARLFAERSEERRVGKEGRSRWSPYH